MSGRHSLFIQGSVNFMAGGAFHSFASAARQKRALCGDYACRSALAVAPCAFILSTLSAEIARVEALSLWRRADLS